MKTATIIVLCLALHLCAVSAWHDRVYSATYITVPERTSTPAFMTGSFSTSSATVSGYSPGCGGGEPKDVWSRFRATCTGTLKFTTCHNGSTRFDTRVAVWTANTSSSSPSNWRPVTSIGCNDDNCSEYNRSSWLSVPVQNGQWYFLQLGGYSTFTGSSSWAAWIICDDDPFCYCDTSSCTTRCSRDAEIDDEVDASVRALDDVDASARDASGVGESVLGTKSVAVDKGYPLDYVHPGDDHTYIYIVAGGASIFGAVLLTGLVTLVSKRVRSARAV